MAPKADPRRVVDMDGGACRVEDDERIADGGRKALRRQAVQPAAVGRRGAVGLALASRAAGREQGGDEEEQDGADSDRRRNAGGKADRKHGSRAGGEHPAVLSQPPRCKAQEPARPFFPSGLGHRLPIA